MNKTYESASPRRGLTVGCTCSMQEMEWGRTGKCDGNNGVQYE